MNDEFDAMVCVVCDKYVMDIKSKMSKIKTISDFSKSRNQIIFKNKKLTLADSFHSLCSSPFLPQGQSKPEYLHSQSRQASASNPQSHF
jgi:hypothetical protein